MADFGVGVGGWRLVEFGRGAWAGQDSAEDRRVAVAVSFALIMA